MNKLTVEEYFIQQHGGKTPDESVNHGETFTAIAMTIFADGYASQYKADLTDSLEERALKSHGKPCSCWMCRNPKYNRAKTKRSKP